METSQESSTEEKAPQRFKYEMTQPPENILLLLDKSLSQKLSLNRSQYGGCSANSDVCSNNVKVSATTNNISTIPATSRKNGSDGTVSVPNTFHVKYLGKRPALGLWGIKYTRQPVDEMAAAYHASLPNISRPILKLEVYFKGMTMPQNKNLDIEAKRFPINSISYCVQDTVYDRIFAIIVVQNSTTGLQQHPFESHAFVCDKQQSARDLSFSLATVFQVCNHNNMKQELPTVTEDSEVGVISHSNGLPLNVGKPVKLGKFNGKLEKYTYENAGFKTFLLAIASKERNQQPFSFSFFNRSTNEKTSKVTKPKKSETKRDSKSNTKLRSIDNVAATSASCSNNVKVSATTNNISTIPAKSRKNGSDGTVSVPNTFHVKYLGKRPALGLWGIKYTRQPVDEMAAAYRASLPNMSRPILKLEVSFEGITVSALPQNKNPKIEAKKFPINSISYCVQDTVYDRIFAIIVVQDSTTGLQQHPFECHAFVCDKQQSAGDLSLSLATVSQVCNHNNMKQELPTETEDSEV
ncbi:uncharacterized protein LOC143233103 [Tachypleus tridentatus]|uniref:uncharacterized protein LOC143233103 n=1 Tax=Tachypleus tridentatus TaxID=6853 RepID=UPI003FD42530